MKLSSYATVLCLALGFQGSHAAPRWTSSLDDNSGLPTLEVGGERAINTTYSFWGANWAWTDIGPKFKEVAPGKYEMQGHSDLLGVTAQERTSMRPEGGWISDFDFQDGAGKPGVIGGGMVFHFDVARWGALMGDPVLLPNNQGWHWGKAGGPQIEARFDPPLASVYFEQGQKSELRAFFFNGKVPAGELHHRVTWSTTGVETQPLLTARLGGSAQANAWPVDTLDNASPVPDLSFLNLDGKPAGRHGAAHVVNGELAFGDGTPARFWGTNVTAYALFQTSQAEVKTQAKRLAALGYNLVRIHHMDSPWVGLNVFGEEGKIADTQTLDATAMARLDWWIKCLKDEGIYVWLDLHVQRTLRAGDHIDGFDEMRKGAPTADLKGYNYVNPSIQQAMKRFSEAYLGHKNTYTGLAYKDDPAVLAVLLTNENDLTEHYGNSLLQDKNVPWHDKIYLAAASDFAKQTGLPSDKVWRSWEPGPSRIFLNELEHRFDVDAMASLQRDGAKMPVATTNSWGSNLVSSLPSLTTGDVIDVHAYGVNGTLEMNPLYGANLVNLIASAQVVGYPLTVSEWNVGVFPAPDRHVLPLYVAATAAHQGWDALMHFAYTQEPPSGNHPSGWHSYNDPSLMAMMPAAALLYRERHVALATSTYVLDLPAETFFGKNISPGNSAAIRTAIERGRLLVAMPTTKALPWLQRKPLPAGAIVMRDPSVSVLPADAQASTSDTGELARNWNDGTFTINTPRTRAALGWIGGRTIALPDVQFDMKTKQVSVAVQSLDDQPIAQSSDLMISVGTRSEPQSGNRAPFLSEPAAGLLKIHAIKGLKAYVLGSSGKLTQIPMAREDENYLVKLDGKSTAHWIFLRK